MSVEAEIKCIYCCDFCFHSFDDDNEVNIMCEKCNLSTIPDYIKEIKNRIIGECIWKDNDYFDGFNEDYKKCYIQGFKAGILHIIDKMTFNYFEDEESELIINELEEKMKDIN